MATKLELGPNGLVNYTRTAHSSYYAKQFIDNSWPVRDDYYYSGDIYVRGFFHYKSEDLRSLSFWCCVSFGQSRPCTLC
jgi:hypothetical protein